MLTDEASTNKSARNDMLKVYHVSVICASYLGSFHLLSTSEVSACQHCTVQPAYVAAVSEQLKLLCGLQITAYKP